MLDKPAGITSARAVAEVKKIVGAAKVGHTGTLDPFATGVLICCLNRATRLARFFLHGEKRYEAVLRLGSATDTQDTTGQVIARNPVPPLSAETLASVFSRFQGRQMQQPPVYAALKHRGMPLYKLARRGTPVKKAARPVTISALEIMQVKLPDVRFTLTCSAGTYVRTLCADIGQALGCGGHLAELRRTASSGIGIEEAVSLEGLRQAAETSAWELVVVPMAEALREMPVFEAGADMMAAIVRGIPLNLPRQRIKRSDALQSTDKIKVVDATGELKAVMQPAPDGNQYNYCCVFD